MLKQQRGARFDKYALEADSTHATYVYGSMNNISIVTIAVPEASRKIQEKIIHTEVDKSHPGASFLISKIKSNQAIIFLFSNNWKKRCLLKSQIIPEIYMVPFNPEYISVCATRDGYVIRESENSGFRLGDSESVKDYLSNKSYKLYNLNSNDVNSRWEKLDEQSSLKGGWDTHKEYKKIQTHRHLDRRVMPAFLSLMIIASWANIVNTTITHGENLEQRDVELTTELNGLTSAMGLTSSSSYQDVMAKIQSRPEPQSYRVFKSVIAHHFGDEFEIAGNNVRVSGQHKGLAEITGVTVVYDK